MEENDILKYREKFKLKGVRTKEVNVWNFYTKAFEIIVIYIVITEVFNW
jgi:hypothetical protein